MLVRRRWPAIAALLFGLAWTAAGARQIVADDWPCTRDREVVELQGVVSAPAVVREGRVEFDIRPAGPSGSGAPARLRLSWYEASTTAHHIEVMQLSDGARSRVSLPIGPSPPRWWVDDMPAWVTDDEVAIPAHGDGEDPTMLRIARSAFVPVP